MQERDRRGRKDEKDEEKGARGRITLGRTEKGPTGTLSPKPAVYAAIITGERRERYVALR